MTKELGNWALISLTCLGRLLCNLIQHCWDAFLNLSWCFMMLASAYRNTTLTIRITLHQYWIVNNFSYSCLPWLNLWFMNRITDKCIICNQPQHVISHRDYKKFKECIHPLKQACGKGIDMIYDYDGRLRTYLLKMEYICSYARPG